MGFTKRMLEAQQEQRAVATRIALESGALAQCEYHEELHDGDGDVDAAYESAEAKFNAGELHDTFESTDELRSVLEDVIQSQPEECPSCERMNDDD